MRQANRKIRTEKIVMLGAASTGKTSIVNRFAHDRFSQTSESTIGAAFVSKIIKIGDRDVKLEIWDTGGSERYRSLAPMYYRDTHAAIIVFDLTSQTTLDDAKIWLDELRERGPPRAVVACAANKVDLAGQRQIDAEKVKEFAEKNDVQFVQETSALTGQNVNDLFNQVAGHLLSVMEPDEVDGGGVAITAPPTKPKKECC